MTKLFLPVLVLILLLTACSTGKKALEHGDYYSATLQAVKRLRSNPDSKKALNALKDSYPLALSYYMGKIDQSLSSNATYKYSEIVGYYEKLNYMADEINRCPAAMKVIHKVESFPSELANARQKAAEEQYQAGLRREKENTREAWKAAYFHYRQADQFVAGYKDVRERMTIAKTNATLKVVVEPILVPRNYQLTSDFFLNQIMESLASGSSGEFVKFYSPEAAGYAGIEFPDQVLKLNFDEFIVGQVYDKETIQELKRDSVVVGTVDIPGGKKNVYGTVKAKLTTYRRELISNGLLDVTIVDYALNSVISEKKFPGQYVWFTEWGSFNGDERALTKEQLQLCSRKPAPPPGPQALFVEFTKPIYTQVTSYLKSYYNRY